VPDPYSQGDRLHEEAPSGGHPCAGCGRTGDSHSLFLQRAFLLTTGYGIGEYLRNHRLVQAALDLKGTDDRLLDIALRTYDMADTTELS